MFDDGHAVPIQAIPLFDHHNPAHGPEFPLKPQLGMTAWSELRDPSTVHGRSCTVP
jgi:hypothetical protein